MKKKIAGILSALLLIGALVSLALGTMVAATVGLWKTVKPLRKSSALAALFFALVSVGLWLPPSSLALMYFSSGRPCGPPAPSICVTDEFISANGTSVQIGEWGWTLTGAGVSYNQFSVLDGMEGFGIGAVGTDGILGRTGALSTGANALVDVSLYPTLELSAGYGADFTANGNWRFGWTQNMSYTTFSAITGVYFETLGGTDATWFCVAKSGATTRVNTTISNNILISQFLIRKLSSTSYQCCIEGACTTVSSNVPAGNLWGVFTQVSNTGLAEPIFGFVDYVHVYAVGDTR